MTTQEMIASLMSTECPACKNPKRERESLCRRCFGQLTRTEKVALYQKVGEGYEEALNTALLVLA